MFPREGGGPDGAPAFAGEQGAESNHRIDPLIAGVKTPLSYTAGLCQRSRMPSTILMPTPEAANPTELASLTHAHQRLYFLYFVFPA